MIVSCPRCNTKYKVADELIRPEGSKLKCTKCGHIFLQKREEDTNTGVEVSLSSEKISLERPAVNRKRLWVLLTVICGCLIMGVAGWILYPHLIKYLPSHKKTPAPSSNSTTSSLSEIKKIGLEDIKQYMVENDLIGKLLVIQGKAVNHFDKPKALIKVEATLYDSRGKVLKKKDIFCGNTLSLFQLQSWPKKRMEAELHSKVGILMKNTNIPPGGSVDFMVVFYNPPPDISEYGVKVVHAEDVPQK